MTTQEVANRFYELAQQGQFDQIQNELFAEHATSNEPPGAPFKSANSLAEINANGKEWNEVVEEMHGGFTNAPIVAGNFFACTMGMDVTVKGQPRMNMEEIALYEVKDGKIISQRFFY